MIDTFFTPEKRLSLSNSIELNEATAYDLNEEDKKEIESNILNFKKEKFDDIIETGHLLSELVNNMKKNKTNIIQNIENINPVWIRLMSEKMNEVLFSMEELIYQINKYNKSNICINNTKSSFLINSTDNNNIIDIENNISNIEKYKKIIKKREKNKRILKPFLPLLKNNEKNLII